MIATIYSSWGFFKVLVTDQAVADEMVQITRLQCPSKGVMGNVVTGNGGYNAGYSWHLDEHTIDLFEFAIEVCDGSVLYVEERLDLWAGAQFCPWSSHVYSVAPASHLPADVTVDGVVDAADLAALEACLDAPASPCWDAGTGCCAADLDGSRHVDCGDWSLLEAGWTATPPPDEPIACAPPPPALPAVGASRLGALAAALLLVGAGAAGCATRARSARLRRSGRGTSSPGA